MMNIEFRNIDENLLDDYEYIARWYIDKEIYHFINLVKEDEQKITLPDPAKLRDRFLQKKTIINMITTEKYIIGWLNLDINPPFLLKNEPLSGWVGITIGDGRFRSMGIGKQALLRLEELAHQNNLKRIELGVFDFNIAAIKLYEGQGYKYFSESGHFTHWNNKKWADRRMEKYI